MRKIVFQNRIGFGSRHLNLAGLNRFAYRTFASAVYLEKSWLGYKKGYDLNANTDANTILSTFGWGMRHTAGSSASNPPAQYTLIDYTAKISADRTQMRAGDVVTLTYTIKNNTSNVRTIPVYIGAMYDSNGVKYRYDLSGGKNAGTTVTLNQSDYIKDSGKILSDRNDAMKRQYKDNKYVRVSVPANGSYTFSVKVNPYLHKYLYTLDFLTKKSKSRFGKSRKKVR